MVQTAKQSIFFSKLVKLGVRVLRARSARKSHARKASEGVFQRLSRVSLSVFSLVPDLLFDCSRVLEYAKTRTVLQSRYGMVQFNWEDICGIQKVLSVHVGMFVAHATCAFTGGRLQLNCQQCKLACFCHNFFGKSQYIYLSWKSIPSKYLFEQHIIEYFCCSLPSTCHVFYSTADFALNRQVIFIPRCCVEFVVQKLRPGLYFELHMNLLL